VRVVVGPGQDLVARLVGQKLTDAWGQQVIVDPRPGGGGANAADVAAKATADGYTWLLSTAVFTINAGLYARPPFDLVRDFAPAALLGTATFLLVIHPSVPAKSVAELIRLARENPGRLNYSSAGVGTPPHLAGEMLKSMAHIDLFHVPYCPFTRSTPAVDFGNGFCAAAAHISVDGRVRLGPSSAADRHRLPAGRESTAEGTPPGQAHPVH
jgi:tripartite-type tricarboxylate transporter receptor subunit TctC